VPAAIIASMVKIALAVQEGDIADPAGVLMRMNRALCGRFELAYVTEVSLVDRARQWTGADFADDVTIVVVDVTARA